MKQMKTAAMRAGMLAVMLAGTIMIFAGTMGAQPPNPPDPAAMIARQVARLTTLLDLTTSQATQVSTILTSAQSANSAVQTTLQTDHTSLDTAITTNNVASINQLSSAIGTLQGQILNTQAKSAAQIYALLTSAQQTKLAAVGGVEALSGGPGPGGPRGRGPGGPRP